ncbi:MAG: hypothetical protein MJ138_07415 [Kiritimatiellae bacterium]|nr:hypothetical protein [Kiritimatiellia bacterium]
MTWRHAKAFSAVVFAALSAVAAEDDTNVVVLVSNPVTLTNRVSEIVTATTATNGMVWVHDPTMRLYSRASGVAYTAATASVGRIESSIREATRQPLDEWNAVVATSKTHRIVYLDAGFTQDLPALAPNLCGWIAGQYQTKFDNRYFVWFNRELEHPPQMAARSRSAGGDTWMDCGWVDWGKTNWVDGTTGKVWKPENDQETPPDGYVPCRELFARRHNFGNTVLHTTSTVSLGGSLGYNANANSVTVEINGAPAANAALPIPLFYAVSQVGTNRVVTAFTNGFVNAENGFMRNPSNE